MEVIKGVSGIKAIMKRQKIICIKNGNSSVLCVVKNLSQHRLMRSFVVITAGRSIEEQKGLIMSKRNVLSVARNLSKINIQKRKRAQENVEQNYLSIVEIKYIGKADVYNMEVRNHHNYSVCGGFIIHNCMDAIRYVVMGLWLKIKRWLPVQDGDEDEGAE